MKKQKKVNTEIIPIPNYELLNERQRCVACKFKYSCQMNSTRSETGAKIYCQKFAKNFYTIESIIFLAIEIFGMHKIFSTDKDVLTASGIAFAYTVILLILETFISKIAKTISENKEIKRKKKFEEEVEKIKKANEQIKRNQTGETDEYLEFVEKAKNVTGEVKKFNWELMQIKTSQEDKYNLENSKIIDKFLNLSSELEKTTARINPRNYHSNYKLFQIFYDSYINALIEKMKLYIELYENNKLKTAQIEEYNNLLDNFINKINTCNGNIDKVEDREILNDIRQLNNLISSDDNNL